MIISSGHGNIEWRALAHLRRRAAPEIKGMVQTLTGELLEPGDDDEFSRYGYLEPELADDDSASLPGGRTPQQTHQLLEELTERLAQVPPDSEPTGKLPAAYTYFGQFLNHDISAPLGNVSGASPHVGNEAIVNDPDHVSLAVASRPNNIATILDQVVNQHRWPLTLNSVYGGGPFAPDRDGQTRLLYDADPTRFKLGQTTQASLEQLAPDFTQPEKFKFDLEARDLPRDTEHKRALIFDPRNDENLFISQLHLAFLRFHNNAVDKLSSNGSGNADPRKQFEEARRRVMLHYQWCVVHDYLLNLLDPAIYKRGLESVDFCPPRQAVPMEFAAAVFRFGHSMVGSKYNFNVNFWSKGANRKGPGGSASLGQLFVFTSKRDMGGFKVLPNHWVPDWSMLTGSNPDISSKADRIDPLLVGVMLGLAAEAPVGVSSIINFNLLRGFHRRVPSGQKLAEAMAVETLTPKEVRDAVAEIPGLGQFLKDSGLDRETPAWLYVLCEARAKARGNRLGPMASAVVAKTVFGLLRGNPNSLLHPANKYWSPKAKGELRTKDGAPIADIRSFLQFAGVM